MKGLALLAVCYATGFVVAAVLDLWLPAPVSAGFAVLAAVVVGGLLAKHFNEQEKS